MTIPSPPFLEDAAALAERARALDPRPFDTRGFQQALGARAAAAGREEHAANRHGDRALPADDGGDDPTSAAGQTLHAPMTIHALNEMLLVGGPSRNEVARAAKTGREPLGETAQRIDRDPIRPRDEPTGHAARPKPAHGAVGQVEPPREPIALDPRSSTRADAAGAGDEQKSQSNPAPRQAVASDPAAASSAASSPVAGAVAPAPPSSPPRGESASIRPNNAAAGVVQGASAAPPGRRSGADAHLPRWLMHRGAQSSAPTRMSQAVARAEAFAAQVSRGLAAAISRGNGDVTLRLNPESLGFLRVKLEVRPEGVAARFEASTDAARRLLEQNSETLRAALEARGWESAEVRVALLEERDTHPSAAELLRRLAREGEAVAHHAAAEPDPAWRDTDEDRPHDPRSGKDGSAARRPGDDTPGPGGAGSADGEGPVWLAPGAVDVVA